MSLSRMQLILLTYLVALATVFQKSAGELILVPCDTESKVRETTYFNCSTDHLSEEIFWYHGDKYIYTGSVIFEPYDKRFQIDRNASNGAYNLILHSVEPGDAGEYSCVDEDGSGTKKSAQLIVLDGDPQCQSNIRPDGVIGQNIFNITPDEVQLSCNVIYYGNVPPQMEWKKVGENSSIKDNVTSNAESNNRYTYKLKFKGDVSLDKSSYVCQTTRSRNDQYNCSSENINVLYFIGGVMKQVNISRGDELTCNATNNTFSCTKQWYHGDNTCPLSCGETFTTHLLGEYLCTVKCRIRGKDYDFSALKAFVFEETTTPSPSPSWGKTATAVLASIILLILVVIFASSVAIYKKRRAHAQKVKRYDDKSLEDMIARKPLFKTDDLEMKNENVNEEELELLGKLKEEKRVKAIMGVAILGEELYIVRERSSQLEVYGCKTLTLQRTLPELTDLVTAVDICSCKKNTCLYIMDKKIGLVDKEILKIDTQGKLIKKWHTINNAAGYLSTTEEGNVIITVQMRQLLLEYSEDGSLLHVRNVSECVNPRHAIKLHTGLFNVSHGMLLDVSHRVCLVDKQGKVQKTFGGEVGSAVDQLNMPFYLAVGSSGFVVVADLINNRVLLLDSNLEWKTNIVPRYKQRFQRPIRVHLDETKGLLIVVITAGNPRDRIPEEADNAVKETEGGSLPESKGMLNQKVEENEVNVSDKIEEDCRILAFDIKPVLKKYKLTVEGGCLEEKEEGDHLA